MSKVRQLMNANWQRQGQDDAYSLRSSGRKFYSIQSQNRNSLEAKKIPYLASIQPNMAQGRQLATGGFNRVKVNSNLTSVNSPTDFQILKGIQTGGVKTNFNTTTNEEKWRVLQEKSDGPDERLSFISTPASKQDRQTESRGQNQPKIGSREYYSSLNNQYQRRQNMASNDGPVLRTKTQGGKIVTAGHTTHNSNLNRGTTATQNTDRLQML